MRRIPLSKSEINIKKFKKGKRINKGGFGIVYKVEDKETGEIFAAKVIDCNDEEERCNEIINREVGIMMYANHPTIIKFLGYSKVDFQEEHNITILMELATNGSLREVLKNIQDNDGPKDYTNTTRQIILVGIVRGMKYLHDHDIIHRDLKAENILLDDNFHPHITDFGLSKFIEIGHSRSQTNFGGTLAYKAPEILKQKPYDKKVDVYSFAILMFEILTDQPPYPELESGEISEIDFMNKVINEHYRPKFGVPVQRPLRELIKRCWSSDPDERPTFDELFDRLSNEGIGVKDGEDEDNEEIESYMLDGVDMEEFKLYVDEVSAATDITDKFARKIAEIERENRLLKQKNKKIEAENKQRKSEIKSIEEDNEKLEIEMKPLNAENKQPTKAINIKRDEDKQAGKSAKKISEDTIQDSIQTIVVVGINSCNSLFGYPKYEKQFAIRPQQKLPLDASSLLSYSIYFNHSVLVTRGGTMLGAGNNSVGHIGISLKKTEIKQFTEFCIEDRSGCQLDPISAVCTENGTLYMFAKSSGRGRQLVYCDCDINRGTPVFLDIGDEEPVSLFGGRSHVAAISDKGEVIFFHRYSVMNSPSSRFEAVSLPDGEKAVSVACLSYPFFALSANGRVFSSPVDKYGCGALSFSAVEELAGEEIVCLSGIHRHCLAVSKGGRVFGCGSTFFGELGLGKETKSVSSFTLIRSLGGYEIRAAYAGHTHSLFETREGKIIACGCNYSGELLLSSGRSNENVYSPTETAITGGASFCIAGCSLSVVFIGCSPPPNEPNRRIDHY